MCAVHEDEFVGEGLQEGPDLIHRLVDVPRLRGLASTPAGNLGRGGGTNSGSIWVGDILSKGRADLAVEDASALCVRNFQLEVVVPVGIGEVQHQSHLR